MKTRWPRPHYVDQAACLEWMNSSYLCLRSAGALEVSYTTHLGGGPFNAISSLSWASTLNFKKHQYTTILLYMEQKVSRLLAFWILRLRVCGGDWWLRRHRHLRKAHNTRSSGSREAAWGRQLEGAACDKPPLWLKSKCWGMGVSSDTVGQQITPPNLLLASVAPPFLLGQACCWSLTQ